MLGAHKQNGHSLKSDRLSIKSFRIFGAGRGGRTPMTLRSADFESAASASSTIPAWVGTLLKKYRTAFVCCATAQVHFVAASSM
jgi:hypothetical protein